MHGFIADGKRSLQPRLATARAVIAFAAIAATPQASYAQSNPARRPPEPVPIVIEIESDCATAREFFEQVRRRTDLAREAKPGGSGRRFRVTIVHKDQFVGSLLAENEKGTTAVREIEGGSCVEVADALALVLAVALDPLADQSDSPRMVTVPTPLRVPPSADSPPLAPHAHVVGTRPRTAASWQHAIGGEGLLAVGLVDKPMLGLGGRYWGSLLREHSAGLLVTVGAFATFPATAQAHGFEAGSIRYRLQAVSASVCPLGTRLHDGVRLYPCAAMSAGRLEARGINLPGAQPDAGLSVAASLEGRWLIRVGGPVRLVGAAGLSFPLDRYTVVVAADGSNRPVDKTNAVGFVGALGLALM